jgi:molecular chaperone GrpE
VVYTPSVAGSVLDVALFLFQRRLHTDMSEHEETEGAEPTAGESNDGGEDAGDPPTTDPGVGDASDAAGEHDEAAGETALSALVGDTESDTDERAWQADPEAVTVDEDIEAAVEDAPPAEIARAIATLQTERDRLADRLDEQQAQVDDLESRLKRKQADFQNYKKRQKERLEEEKQRATEKLAERLLDVRDSLQRALDQDETVDIRSGVETTLSQFDEQLARENVERVEPAPGDPVDPQRHEALATVPSKHPENTIADVHRPGYEMAGKLLRPAQVTVSDGSGHDSETGGDDHATDETEGDAAGQDEGENVASVDDTADSAE